LRCFILLDSDRDSNNIAIDYKHTHLVSFLNQSGIRYHILEKRAMENYMPLDVYNELRDGKLNNWIDAFLNLNSRQKDFLNIPKGFAKKSLTGDPIQSRHEQNTEVIGLYNSLSDVNYNIINEGFKFPDLKSSFPIRFTDSSNVHWQSLVERTKDQDNPNELFEIILKMEELL
jgi:hypothetical protein